MQTDEHVSRGLVLYMKRNLRNTVFVMFEATLAVDIVHEKDVCRLMGDKTNNLYENLTRFFMISVHLDERENNDIQFDPHARVSPL